MISIWSSVKSDIVVRGATVGKTDSEISSPSSVPMNSLASRLESAEMIAMR